MADVFDEVEEQVRRERYEGLFKKYGPLAIGLFVAVLIGVGGWRAWVAWSESQARDASIAFVAAQRDARGGDAKAAETAFKRMSGSAPGIYRELALMELAGLHVNKGELEEALTLFDQTATQATDPIVRDAARIRAAYIAADTEDFADVRARLEPMIDEGGPFEALARELLGVEAWEAGEIELARRTVAPLPNGFDTPEAARERARILLAVLGPAAESPNTDATTDADTDASAAKQDAPRGDTK